MSRLAGQEPVRVAREALAGEEGVWIVGGAVRDAALDRAVTDIDLAVTADPGAVARRIADAAGGFAFELSAEFGSWRAAARDRSWQVDVTALRGEAIAGDLALATSRSEPLPYRLGARVSSTRMAGLADLEGRVLRVVGPAAFEDDPLRLLRAPRLAAELGLQIDQETADLARRRAHRAAVPAGERQLAELRALIAGPDPLGGLRLMDELGVTAAVLPEVEAMRGVEQSPNHHLDVYGHTLAVLDILLEIEADLPRYAGDRADEVAGMLAEPLADDLTRGDALRFGALLHDIGKPATAEDRGGLRHVHRPRRSRGGDRGRDLPPPAREPPPGGAPRRPGAPPSAPRLPRPERPLPPRTVHEYLRATGDVAVDVTLLTVADRLAARGSGPLASDEMVEAHLDLAREMLAAGARLAPRRAAAAAARGRRAGGRAGHRPGTVTRRGSRRARSRTVRGRGQHARRGCPARPRACAGGPEASRIGCPP